MNKPVRITIVRRESGDMEIVDGERTTLQLTLGEVLEMVVKLMYPEMPGPRYPMRTPDEWRAIWPESNNPILNPKENP